MSLRVWLPLNGDLHNQGISEITFSGTPIWQNFGKIGNMAYNLSTRTSFNCPTLANVKYFSIAFWCMVQPNAESTANWMDILSLTDKSTSDTIGYFRFETGYGNTAYGGIHWHDNATNAIINGSYIYNTASEQNQWHHIVVTVSSTAVCSYYDGVLKQTNVSNLGGGSLTGAGWIGESTTRGGIQDVRIYDHCLSAAEVKEIAQGLVLHYKLDNSINLTNNNINTWTNFSIGQYYTTIWEMPISSFVEATGAKNGDQFTFSIDINAISGQKPLKARVQQYKSSDDRPTVLSTEVITASSSGRSSVTFTLNTDYTTLQLLITNHNTSITTTTTEQWKCIKLEWGNKATPWCQTYNNNIIEDSSGYNHNGEILNGPLSFANDTSHYDICTHFSATNQKIKISNFPTSGFGNSYTFAWWAKISSVSPMHWGFGDGIRLNGMYTGRLWNTGDGSNNPLYNPGTTTQVTAPTVNVWHHWVMTGDGTKCRVYQDGELWGEAKTYKAISGSTIYINGWNTATDYSSNNYSISDFRIYCTPLLDTDIKQLYNVGMKIDKQANIHPFEINENKYNKITKTGILYNNIVEPYLTLPDGSNWKLLLYHYVDGGKNLFTQSNATYCNELGLYSRLKDINNYTYNDKYEFYVIQDDIEYRWTQTSQPTAASISGLTTVNGYTNPVNGLAKANQSNTYLGYNSWWGACGCWTQYSTGGKTGIPGFGTHNADGMCTEYLALYARIDDSQASFINLNSEANQFIER